MSIVVAYPYDPNGTNPACKIADERHVITTLDNTYRVIAPELAPFFRKGLKIIHAASAHLLVEGVDYYLGNRLESVKAIAASPLFATIVLINPNLFGEFVLEYQTIGSTFVGIRSQVLTYLANYLVDPVKTPFERVIDRPEYYTPHEHEMHYADFINKTGVAEALQDLNASIEAAAVKEAEIAVGDLEQRITALNALLTQYRFNEHIVDTTNPHNVTAVQANALPAHQSAVDAFNVFNRTLVDLAAYINNRGITQADIDLYLRKITSQTLKDTLTLKDGNAIIRNSNANVSLNLASGEVVLVAPSLVELAADTQAVNANTTNELRAGVNNLTLTSDGTTRALDRLRYNGKMIYTSRNIADELTGLGASSSRMVTVDSPTVQLSGAGWAEAPLVADLRLAVATLTVKGITSLSSVITGNRSTVAATAKAINLLYNKVALYVPETTRINNYPLTDDVTVTLADLRLDMVDNTNDLEKPISGPQQTLLDAYADKVHKHPVADIEVPIASEDVKGVMSKVDNFDDITSIQGGVTPRQVKEMAEQINQLEYDTSSLLHSSVLNIKHWRTDMLITVDGFVLTIPADAQVYLNQVDFVIATDRAVNEAILDVAALYPTAHKNTVFHVYMKMVNGDIDYVIRKTKTAPIVSECFLFSLATDDAAFVTATEWGFAQVEAGNVFAEPVTSVGGFAELEDHLAENRPHGGGDNSGLAHLGLDLLKNRPVTNGLSVFSHDNLSRWDRLGPTQELTVEPASVADDILSSNVGVRVVTPVAGSGNVVFHDPDVLWESNAIPLRTVSYVLECTNPTTTGVAAHAAVIGVFSVGQFNGTDAVALIAVNRTNLVTLEIRDRVSLAMLKRVELVTANKGHWQYGRAALTFTYNVGSTTPLTMSVHFPGLQYSSTVQVTLQKETIPSFLIERTYRETDVVTTFDSKVVSLDGDTDAAQLAQLLSVPTFGWGYSYLLGSGGGAQTSRMTVSCIRDTALDAATDYLSAEAVYNALKTNGNIMVLTGTTNGLLPVPPACSRYVVRYGWGKIGLAGPSGQSGIGNGLDGIDIRLTATTSPNVPKTSMLVTGINTLDPHRLELKYKIEGDGNGPDVIARTDGYLNYMIIAYRDI